MKRVFPILAVLTGVLLGYALYEALVVAPTEQTMGNVQRIFYYHVPSAWTAFILFFINFFASIVYLIFPSALINLPMSGHAELWEIYPEPGDPHRTRVSVKFYVPRERDTEHAARGP